MRNEQEVIKDSDEDRNMVLKRFMTVLAPRLSLGITHIHVPAFTIRKAPQKISDDQYRSSVERMNKISDGQTGKKIYFMHSLITNEEITVGNSRRTPWTSARPFSSVETCDSGQLTGACFTEKDRVLAVLAELSSGRSHLDIADARSKLSGVTKTLEGYREDPSLLTPHIVEILRPVFSEFLLPSVESIHKTSLWSPFSSLMCSLVYTVTTICGLSSLTLNEVFPHDVSLLRSVADALESIHDSWESRFVLTIWLSVLVRSPFAFQSMNIQQDRLFEISINQLNSGFNNASLSKATGLLISRLLVRSDCPDWLSHIHTFPEDAVVEVIYRTLKAFPRRLTASETEGIMRILERFAGEECEENIGQRKYLIRALGLVASLSSPTSCIDHIEVCINMILSNLGDRDGSVRYAVAKTVAGIAISLPECYRHQFFSYLLLIELLNDYEVHTICLIHAELIRRSQTKWLHHCSLKTLTGVAVDALERERDSLPMTHQIRDAGCCIVWFLARNVSPTAHLFSEVLQPTLCPLVIAALFDRDINMRRAASAALQELVGRVGSQRFPDGLSIIKAVDFWTVSNVNECFTSIPIKILSSLENAEWAKKMFSAFLKHLINEKMFKSTSNTLTNLASRRFQLLAAEGIAQLLFAWPSEHHMGTVEAMGSVATDAEKEWHERLAAITFVDHYTRLTKGRKLPEEIQSLFRNIVPVIEKKRLYRGKGGDLIRSACYSLLASVHDSLIEFKDFEKFYIKTCEILKEGIVHLVDGVQDSALDALAKLIRIRRNEDMMKIFFLDPYIEQLSRSSDVNIAARRGMVRAISLLSNEPAVVELLCKEATSWPKHWLGNSDLVDSKTREYAIVGLHGHAVTEKIIYCLDDFQTDKRGDVGSMVRLRAIEYLVSSFSKCDLNQKEKIILNIASHCGERLDRIRDLCYESIPDLIGSNCSLIELLSGCPFEFLSKLIDHYSTVHEFKLLIKQFMVSVGGVTPNRAAESAFLSIKCKQVITEALIELLNEPLRGTKSDYINRVFVPAINCLYLIDNQDQVLSSCMVLNRIHYPLVRGAAMSFSQLKAVSKLYVRHIRGNRELAQYFLEGIILSDIPKLRQIGVVDLVNILCVVEEGGDLIDVIEACDWLSENENDWSHGVSAIQDYLGVVIPSGLKKVAGNVQIRQEGYADFIKEVYRYS